MSKIAVDDVVILQAQRARWVIFLCAGDRFGFPLDRVREIVAPRRFTRLPGAAPAVSGLIGVRGRAVTVLDLGIMLGRRPATTLPDHRLLLLDLHERRIGVAVDEIVAIEPAQLQAPAGTATAYMTAALGTGIVDGDAFTGLDPVRLCEALLETN